MNPKKIIKKILEKGGYVLVRPSKIIADPDIRKEEEFMEVYSKCKDYTMVSIEKSYALYKAVQYIVRNEIEGDFVECGVWKGGQAMLIAYTLIQEGVTNRKIYLYDTFAGMTEPTDDDTFVGSGKKVWSMWDEKRKEKHNDWCYAPLEEVQENIKSTNYLPENFVYVKGPVEETIPATLPGAIALLRLDTDWYDSTYHELVHMYPLLSKNGVLIVDDYGTWEGSRKATDLYFSEQNTHILLNKVGKSGRIAVKI